MKVLILGASGFVGTHLTAALNRRGDTVVAGSLRDPAAAAAAADGCDAVVNLAGASVAQRWTPEVKRAIRESRTTAPARFLAALEGVARRPRRYVSASAIGYYGVDAVATFDETSAAGTGFLAEVCVAWEATAERARALDMETAIVRTGLVCGADGGALAKLLPLFRLGLGGPVGDGRQWYSWIHIDDVVGVYLHALDGATGVLNATAPRPVVNADFTVALGRAARRPAVLPVPAFAMRLLLGEGATVVLDGQRVEPARTLASGYVFAYPEVDAALRAIAG